ncbi:hypothetical protein OROHE_013752 [Orobanche hederae]
MESDRTRNTLPDGVQRAPPSHGEDNWPHKAFDEGAVDSRRVKDKILSMAVHRFKGKNWKKIAEFFKDRTDVQCLHRWQKVLNPDLVKGPWSKEEDEIIIELVNKYGPKKWSTIAQNLPGRIGKQCRERWHNHLNPGINKEAWTQDEELALIRAHQTYGNKWAELTKFLPGRSDNAIKNHWNSSVKKKMDVYFASGLLSQFQDPPLISQSYHSVVSSPSRAQQNSEDDRDGAEVEEASEGNQGSNNSISQPPNNATNGTECPRGDCKASQESSPIPCSDDRTALQEVACVVPGACELGDNFPEHDFSLDWSTFAGNDWKPNTNELPDMSLLDLGQELSGNFMASLIARDNHETIPFPTNTNLIVNSDCEGVHAEDGHDGCPSDDVIRDFNRQADALLHNSSKHQMPFSLSDMMATSFTQPSPVPDQYNCSSHVNAEQESTLQPTHDGFVYARELDCFPCEQESNSANGFVLAPRHSQCCSSKDKNPIEPDDTDSGALFYEPPRFPGMDIPFFSCDLTQSGITDMNQEFSPLGIRQLMISSMTPFKLWDSPSRYDNSPVAALKSAAKSFTGTPSILKKRHRDLLSPLSEKREEKKLEGISEESISDLRVDISRLEVMFNECIDQKGTILSFSPNSKRNFELHCTEKENVAPACCEQAKNGGNESILISESMISHKEFNVSKCSETIKEQPEIRSKAMGEDAMDTAKEFSGNLVEHDMSDLLFFSPDRFGIKSDKSIGVSARAILSPSETSCFSVVCSPRFHTKKDVSNNLVVTTSLQSLSPSEKKVKSSSKGKSFENNSIYVDTPFKRSMESPSPWKSPWFMNNFVPGPRVDTDITIEDIGYSLSPADQSYDAIGLMKQLGERTAGAFADAVEILGDETPETLLEEKCSVKKEAETENIHSPNSHKEHYSSNIKIERRTLDFNECGTPGKETGKSPSSISFSSPSSYLLKSCR